ncbi:MAG TPA: OmpA family protein, partial [Thermoanaerobaculia bacterium]|nr:OmpA family protein [Thermoanaerobaculia bacterium]
MTSDILFDFNSAALRPGSRETLNELATNFSQYPDNEIIVEGHTDSVGSDAYNQKLSEQRAATVADYLIDRGVRASNVIVYGYGELRPKATNDTADGRQLNRRVEIHIRAPQQASADVDLDAAVELASVGRLVRRLRAQLAVAVDDHVRGADAAVDQV